VHSVRAAARVEEAAEEAAILLQVRFDPHGFDVLPHGLVGEPGVPRQGVGGEEEVTPFKGRQTLHLEATRVVEGSTVLYRLDYVQPVRNPHLSQKCLGFIWGGELLRWFGYSKTDFPERMSVECVVSSEEIVEEV
jgi:hypothetical protein